MGHGVQPGPLMMAFGLGPLLENNLRKSLVLFQGDFAIFGGLISAVCLAFARFLLRSPLGPRLGGTHEVLAGEEAS